MRPYATGCKALGGGGQAAHGFVLDLREGEGAVMRNDEPPKCPLCGAVLWVNGYCQACTEPKPEGK